MSSSRAVGLLVVLIGLNVLNFADRYLLIAFSDEIIPDLGLSHFQFGLLTGIIFTTVYTVFGLFTGALADRLDRTYVIGIGLLLWSAMTAVTGAVKSFGQMAAARMFIGVGEACLTPAAVSMLGDAFAPRRRALVSGLYYMGLPIGVGGAFIFAAAFGSELGWRGSFLALGAVGMVAAILVMVFLYDPPREKRAPTSLGERAQDERMTAERRDELRRWTRETMGMEAAEEERGTSAWLRDSFVTMWAQLRGNPAFAATLAAGTAYTFVMAGGVLDLLWWVTERGYESGRARQITGVIVLSGGILGTILGGVGADWCYRRFRAGRLRFLGWISVIAVPLMVTYRLIPADTPLFYSLAVIGAMLSLAMFGPIFATVQELAPPGHRSAAVAWFLLCSALIGAGGGNATVGLLSDLFSAAGAIEPLTQATLCMALFGLLPIPLFFLAARLQARASEADTAPADGLLEQEPA